MTAPTLARSRLAGQLEVPVVRAGLALVSSAGITSLLGLVYWSIAARQYPAAAVGAAAALLAAMEVVAAIANLGLKTALIRFVPALGRRAARVVAAAYGLAGAVALAAATVFVAVHGRWFPELTLLDEAPGAAFFLLSTVLWVIFFLQDSVLVGIRRATWVPVENALFALAKLGLLVALLTPMPTWGIYVSWCAPLLLVVVGVNLPAFRLLRRGAGQADEQRSVGDLVRFSAGDYAASALWLGTLHVLPLLVLALAGAAGSAWYHLAWTVAYTLYLVTSSVGSALVAEGAHDPRHLEEHAARAGAQAALFVLPAAALIVVAAPWVLQLFGQEYADEGTTLLRLVAASAVPHLVTGLYVNLERARRNLGAVILVYALLGVGVVVTSALLIPRLGVAGAGVAWLATQCLLASWLLLTRLRGVWVGALPTGLLRLLGTPGRWRARLGHRRRARAVVPPILREQVPSAGDWHLLGATPDLLVVGVDSPDGAVVLKLADGVASTAARAREQRAHDVLATAPEVAGWPVAVPRSLAAGTGTTGSWTIESSVPGRSATSVLASGLAPDAVLRAGAEALAGLHRPTSRDVVVGDPLLQAWVEDPVAVLTGTCPEVAADLAVLAAALTAALADRTVTLSWTHGDAAPGNLLVDEVGAVTGIVDWEGARGDGLPELDLVTLIATVRAEATTRELGEVALDLLDRPWTEEEVGVLATGPNDGLPRDALVVLAWLHHVAACLRNSDAYAGHRTWLLRNVVRVAPRLAGRASATAPTAPPESAPAGEPASDPAPGPDAVGRRQRRWNRGAALAIPMVALAGWWVSLRAVDLRAMDDLGLVAVLPPVALAALVLLLGGLAVAVTRPRPDGAVVTTHVAALVAMAFATPAALYGTLRYSWAWKHVGIVDYIDRFGRVDPDIGELSIYHNWPGFFAGSRLLQDLAGVDDVILLARWAPLVLLLATTAAVALLADSFTDDRRVVGLTAGLFVLGDWVGQEYFSPQAFALLAYVVAVALTLRLGTAGSRRPVTVVAVAVLAVAIASSHQLTPAMLILALVGLALVRLPRVAPVAVLAVVATATWALWAAGGFVGENVRDAVEGFGQPVANAQGTLTRGGGLEGGQALVALAGRGIVLLIGLLAVIGVLRRWRAGDDLRAPLVLLLTPAALLAANSFGGEILFRVYLFALPAAAYFAAHALLDLPGLRRGPAAALAPFVVMTLLAGGFLLAHFGKDGYYRFTPEEVAAATWLYENAPEGSLLIEGSRNYPTQFRNYERFRYVPLDREDLAARREIARAPVATMTRWMSDPDDVDAYLLITRSQRREAEALGLRPADLLGDLEAALRVSPRFAVAYENRDAVVFTPADPGAAP